MSIVCACLGAATLLINFPGSFALVLWREIKLNTVRKHHVKYFKRKPCTLIIIPCTLNQNIFMYVCVLLKRLSRLVVANTNILNIDTGIDTNTDTKVFT